MADVNATFEIGKKAATAFSQALQALPDIADRGNAFDELAGSFERLQGGAGPAKAALESIRGATQGLLSDVQIFKSANLAEQLDLSRESFMQLAGAADTLGDAIGVGTNEALEAMVRALGTGQERQLKMLGITVDSAKAQEDFAKSIGTTAKQLNEAGKLAAFQAAALEKIAEKTKTLSGESVSLADGFTRVSNAAANAIDRFASMINQMPALASGMDEVAKSINLLAESFEDMGKVEQRTLNAGDASMLASIKTAEQFQAKIKQLKDLQRLDLEKLRTTQDADEFERVSGVYESHSRSLKALGVAYGEFQEKQKEGVKRFIATGTAAEDAAKKLDEFNKKLAGDELGLRGNVIADGLKRAVDSLDAVQFNNLLEQFKETTRQGIIQGYGDAGNDPAVQALASSAAEKAATEYRDEFADKTIDVAKNLQDKLQDSIKASADFFSDAFYNVFTGASFDFGDMLKRFGAGILGGIAGQLVPGIGQFGDLQGLGQALGGSLISGGTGGILSSLLPGVGGAAGGAAAGAATSGAGATLTASLTAAAPAIGAAMAGAFIYQTQSKAIKDGVSGTDAAFIGLDTVFPGLGSGLSRVAGAFGIGGRGKGGREADARGAFIDSLGERGSFRGIRGNIDLDASGFNFSKGKNAFSDQAVGLTNPFAQVLGGGDKKLTADINNIFADAIDDGKNFNEILIQAQSLMNKLGIDAGAAKDQITQMWLDGEISLEEYNASLGNLNVLQQNNLQGTGAVSDAIAIMTDETATARARIHAMGLAFVEMKELGIDSTSEVQQYVTEKYGPEVAKVFRDVGSIGIDTFDEVAAATADQINFIANAFNSVSFGQQFADQAKFAADSVEKEMGRVKRSIEDAANTGATLFQTGGGGGAPANSSKIDPNPKNYASK